ncbi:MAG: OsmC family protein [gamma proteobacterium symbiont of Phacoides pectinatus]
MSKEGEFTIHMEHIQGYEFKVNFDLQGMRTLLMDEPPPLGDARGPNPSRLLTAAAANCLSASLLYCVSKSDPPAGSLRTSATCALTRNDRKRLRIDSMQVRLQVDGELEQAVRMKRCLALFEDFCVVTDSLRHGFPIGVEVVNPSGEVLHQAEP